jgi:hypothetical protein
MTTADTTTEAFADACTSPDALPDSAPVPDSAFGPARSEAATPR